MDHETIVQEEWDKLSKSSYAKSVDPTALFVMRNFSFRFLIHVQRKSKNMFSHYKILHVD